MSMWITNTKRRGFTLIELLVVIAIIGILTTVASVSLTQARRRARDTKRVSDIQQIRNGLVIYSNQRATYPPADSPTTADIVLGTGNARCLDDSNDGFNAGDATDACVGLDIMQRVPAEQTPPPRAQYVYRKTAASEYEITFQLDGEIGDLSSGNCTATVDGITCVPLLP